MPKTTYILAVMLYAFVSYGQDITFHKNVNYRASSLLQSFDKERSRLSLECATGQILQVDIFNNDFSESIDVNNKKTDIDLNSLPSGDFVIQAKLEDKWIVMYLEKSGNQQNSSAESQNAIVDLEPEIIKANDKGIAKKPSSYYWVVLENKSRFGSNKSMRLERKDAVDKIISKKQKEVKSGIGKNNVLHIYEIYNKSKFMTKQIRNPVYYKSESSELFNVVPVYCSLDSDDIDD